MQVFAYQATERGIRARHAAQFADERAMRLAAQRATYEAELAERERIERVRAEATERARAYAAELRLAGFRFRPTVAEIERRACRVFGVTRKEIHSNRRYQEIVFAKQFVMYWAVRLTPLSLPQIGRLIGDRDHTTVIHGSNSYPQKRAKMGRFLRAVR
ncbi:helix-turn-helix domain-containing protein [Mesorhizobium wenxiniae]|uniref:Chromosomal replication initiator DnaA C-terminal domain-containing protein n=1 Tax=Mesorhizobium wenxiniae TaxID=2014805 RepID=A0A271KDZ9_9HYPH|nr:hypothetical protein CIT31_16715 [Mesorhizobium wenxiniae]